MNSRSILCCLCILLCPCEAYSDDDELDLDFFFSKNQKSTIEDFPLKEIDSDELSNAAIEGALQANNTGSDVDAKPIYQEQKEKGDRKKVSSTNKEKDQLEIDRLLKFSQQTSAPPAQMPAFITPSIRELQVNSTTVERP